jgi:hypothetical protein
LQGTSINSSVAGATDQLQLQGTLTNASDQLASLFKRRETKKPRGFLLAIATGGILLVVYLKVLIYMIKMRVSGLSWSLPVYGYVFGCRRQNKSTQHSAVQGARRVLAVDQLTITGAQVASLSAASV